MRAYTAEKQGKHADKTCIFLYAHRDVISPTVPVESDTQCLGGKLRELTGWDLPGETVPIEAYNTVSAIVTSKSADTKYLSYRGADPLDMTRMKEDSICTNHFTELRNALT